MILCAPLCSSWTRVSRGTSKRTRLNPLGLDFRFVTDANLTIARLLGCHFHVWGRCNGKDI